MSNNIDLGSMPDDFNPFPDDEDFADEGAVETDAADEVETETADDGEAESEPVTPVKPPAEKTKTPAPKQTQTTDTQLDAGGVAANNADAAASENPLEMAVNQAETKTADKARQSLSEKLPVFEYGAAKEEIKDTAITFEDLRLAKCKEDFPELADDKRVSWTVEYGEKFSKPVSDPKGITIAKMKADIEASKEFGDYLKKAKDKSPVCKIKPRVTAQSKGNAAESGYKGVFTCLENVEAAGKVISILPAKDGKVYEIRKTPFGTLTTPVAGSDLLSDVRAGFVPAPGIPRIPMDMMMRIITFFRYYTVHGDNKEVLVNIYWDTLTQEFTVDTPEQIVSCVSVHSNVNPDYRNERYIHFMDIHSHNSMKAYFSAIDDADEKATRLYTVIGRLDSYFPEIKTRISNGGKFHEIDPGEVFEYIIRPFPEEWCNKVSFRKPHQDEKNGHGDYGEDKHRCCNADGDNL